MPGVLIGGSNIPYSATINPNGTSGISISGLQTLDYSHHIRGWLKGINLDASGNGIPNTTQGDLFSYQLDYETAGFYDGNIGSQKWHDGQNLRTYNYSYDTAKRLKSANFVGLGNENYSLPNINYDRNGNILNMQRNGKIGTNSFGAIDNLSYFYSGNRLSGITDAINGNQNVGDFRDNASASDYTYYPNGSLKSDANKGISLIEYNTYLNKVKQVTWSDGRWLKFYYDGAGLLFKKENSAGEYWNYVGDLIYKNGNFYSVNIPEGRAAFENNLWNYEFDYRDIWGNLRVSFSAQNGQLTLKQKSDYDALGYTFNQSSGVNKNYFQYQKQQRIEDFDLNIDFFKFRPSDPTTGRFWMVDPLSSEYPYNSVYALQENKFGMGVELEGLELKEFGTWLGNKVDQVLSYTDVDDITVTVTNFTRGGNAVHIDGTQATSSDKVFAAGGLFLPAVSGGAVKKVFDAVANIKANQAAGAAREVAEHTDLVKNNPGASVQGQQYLRTSDGKIAKDPVTGTGRRLDHVVIKDGKATSVVETTSQNANKNKQLEKEGRIRDSGGTYIRDRNTRELIDVQNTPTEIKRHN